MPRKTRNIHLVENALLTPSAYHEIPQPNPIVPVTGSGKYIEDIDEKGRAEVAERTIAAQYRAESALMTQRCWQQLCCAGLLVGGLAASGGGR
jgi:hypothetical protein